MRKLIDSILLWYIGRDVEYLKMMNAVSIQLPHSKHNVTLGELVDFNTKAINTRHRIQACKALLGKHGKNHLFADALLNKEERKYEA